VHRLDEVFHRPMSWNVSFVRQGRAERDENKKRVTERHNDLNSPEAFEGKPRRTTES
jgi:hypothetical protein